MQSEPNRLKPKRVPLLRQDLAEGDDGSWSAIVPPPGHVLRRLRVFRRLATVLAWTLVGILVQAVMLLLPGRGKVTFPRIYWGGMCRSIGLRVRVIGTPADRNAGGNTGGRPVVYVSNHSSWLDILVLGSRLGAAFIAKDEVANWPLIRTVARLGRTLYVRRSRTSTGRERDAMRERLAEGDSLILFPEGTTSDGSRVLPFRSAFLSVAELPATADGRPPLVQPVSVVYDRLAGLPTGRASRPIFAWYGDMDIGSHFWRLAQHRGLRATVLLHCPLDPAAFASRKELTRAVFAAVADGASTLRQNRPARPIDVPAEPVPPSQPAYA
jgi:lyso-ornithine lipid O-acyltransferase